MPTVIVPALSVSVAAFCVWLLVRIVNRRERWAMWTAAILTVVAAGLAIWWWTRPQDGILFDPIEMQSESNSVQ